MKEPPGMCMKTKVKVTKWTTIETAFCPTMHRLRGNSGRNKRSADLFAAFRACRDRFAAKRCGPLTPTRKTWGPLPAPAGESAGSGPSPAWGEGRGLRETASRLSPRKGRRTSRDREPVAQRTVSAELVFNSAALTRISHHAGTVLEGFRKGGASEAVSKPVGRSCSATLREAK